MAGTTDGPVDVDKSTEHRGSSGETPGLMALDQEREASLADEGGASGAVVESQELGTAPRLSSSLPVDLQPLAARRRRPNFWVLAGAMAAGALGALALRRRR